jgi:hypothetical protein
MNNKLVVMLDQNGHFQVASLSDKFEVFKMIKEDLQGGDAWANEKDNVELNELNYASATDLDFETFVCHFCQRGQMEIVKISL